MSWTQPVCRVCWDLKHPGMEPARVRNADREWCCLCGKPTRQGIYIRIDPTTVASPCGGVAP